MAASGVGTGGMELVHGGYYMVARRYEFYVLVPRTISHLFAELTLEILFLPFEHKIHIFELTCSFLFYCIVKNVMAGVRQLCTQTESCKARNDVIDILASGDMENTPLRSRM